MTKREVAHAAGVTTQAVSNWARRHPNFPRLVRRGSQDGYLTSAVAAWLDGRRIPRPELLPGERQGTTYGERFRSAVGYQHHRMPTIQRVRRLRSHSTRICGRRWSRCYARARYRPPSRPSSCPCCACATPLLPTGRRCRDPPWTRSMRSSLGRGNGSRSAWRLPRQPFETLQQRFTGGIDSSRSSASLPRSGLPPVTCSRTC